MTVLIVLVVLLCLTNAATIAALVVLRRRPATPPPDEAVHGALAATAAAPGPPQHTRRFISVEILNPIELAATRGRVAGIAGSLAPGLTRRIVYDQTVKLLRQRLVEHHVVADVHVHTLRPHRPADTAQQVPEREVPGTLDLEPVDYLDEVDEPVPTDAPGNQPPV